MRKFHHQVKAKKDLKNIWLYSFKEHGEKQADKYFDELITGMKAIQTNPEIGMPCDYIRLGYRQYQINHHFVFYRLDSKKINIIRILHQKMDMARYF